MKLKKLFPLLFSLIIGTLEADNILVDLGNVAIKTDEFKFFKTVGLKRFFTFLCHNPQFLLNKPSIYLRTRLYTLLNAIKPRLTRQVTSCDEYGTPLPAIMLDWLSGKEGKLILNNINQFCHDNPDFFANDAEKDLLLNMTRVMFTPRMFAQTRCLIEPMVAFLKQCKERGDTLYLASNWDKESFEYFKQRFPEFFNLFVNETTGALQGCISGNLGIIKPKEQFFLKLCQRNNITPEQCILIDDRPENCNAAQNVGIRALLVPLINSKDPDINYVKRNYLALHS